MKYYILPTIFIFLLVTTLTVHAQTSLTHEQSDKIKSTCVLEAYLDPVIYLQVLRDSEDPLSKGLQYKADCIEIMINAYQNNESEEEMTNKLTELWLNTYT